jgi:D-alanine-D-alanine ligase
MNVLILHDRISPDSREDERDALVQAEAVGHALSELGHTSQTLPFSLNLAEAAHAIQAYAPDLVFNLVESVEGHGRLIYLAPALLDALGVAYTGARTGAMLLTSTKVLTKKWLRANGVPTPDWLSDPSRDRKGADPNAGRIFTPGSFIIKSVWEDASVGLDANSIVHVDNAAALGEAIASRADRLGGEAFAERYIEGREFNLSMIEIEGKPLVLPPAEIRFVDFPADRPRIVDYEAKWDASSFAYTHTQRSFDFSDSDRRLLAGLQEVALDCWNLFELSGYARVDFRIDADGRPWVLELNANPCLSRDAGFAAAADRAGMTYQQMIEHIVQAATRTRK